MKVTIHTDAGLRRASKTSRAGTAGVGFIIRSEDKEILRQWAIVLDQQSTINEAEYSAIIFGLYNAHTLGATEVALYSDSQLVVNQINGKYGCKQAHLQDCLWEVQTEMERFKKVRVTWIPREENADVDQLVRDLLEEER